MPIIRKRLIPSEVYPDDIRYDEANDKVQRRVNGEWEDAPESDPRKQTTLPPRSSSDPQCDAARNIADALANQIAQIITAIDNGSTAFTIAGLILGLLSFGVFAIFISIALFIADQMLAAGSTALETALTESAYDDLACILYCHMNTQGRINPGELGDIQTQVTVQIGGLAATIFNAMLSLAGEGGLNNLGAQGTSVGDCGDCGCGDEWCFNWLPLGDFATWDAIAQTGGTGVFGVATASGIQHNSLRSPASNGSYWRRVDIQHDSFDNTTVKKITIIATIVKGNENVSGDPIMQQIIINGTPVWSLPFSTMLAGTDIAIEIEGTWTSVTVVRINLASSVWSGSPTYSGSVLVKSITIEGEVFNPFGEDNCLPE